MTRYGRANGNHLLAAIFAIFAWVWPTVIAAQDRLALIVGIDSYREVAPLTKARSDARAIAALMARAGFKVDLVLDADRRDLNRAFADFLGKITPGAVVFFHFSGHGVEIDGNSYLLPADIPKPRAGDQEFVKREAMPLSEIQESFRTAKAAARILVIDACRDNPFAAKGVRSVGATRGIAIIPAVKGSFVIYSASSQQTALDRLSETDPEETAVFTRVFLRHFAEPGRSIVAVARGLRDEVESLAKTAGHEQRPAYYDELSGDFVLFPAAAGERPAPLPPPVPLAQPAAPVGPPPLLATPQTGTASPNTAPPDCRVLYWQSRQIGTCGAYETVARLCAREPEGRFASEIVRRDCRPVQQRPGNAGNLYRVPVDVADGYLNLRAGPSVGHATLARIPAGEAGLRLVNCRRADDGTPRLWCNVAWRGLTGFVSSCCIVNAATGAAPPGASPAPSGAPTSTALRAGYSVPLDVSDGFLNMRAGPGQRHAVVTRIPAGATNVSVGACRAPDDGGRLPWCSVAWQGRSGWASSCCLRDANGARPR